MKHFFTSESVTKSHPDKLCDCIADAILDAALAQDSSSKMAVEATIKDDFVLIYGEAGTTAQIAYAEIAKKVLKESGFDEEFTVFVKVGKQSSEIHEAVVRGASIKAGDQGIMFGYACDETDTCMPMSIMLAHKLAHQLTEVREQDKKTVLKPDGKTQVTVEYDGDILKRIDTILVSSQHFAHVSQDELKDYIMEKVILPVVQSYPVDDNTKYIINPSGSFVVGGPFGDSGTTGRKIVVDTYGGHGRIGGGCLSSKDASKVDRTAAYYCRYVAKNIVAHGLAKKCEIQVAYAIGQEKPLSVFVDTCQTSTKSEEEILAIVYRNFDFTVQNMIAELDLLQPIYQLTAAYGHFGREDVNFPWEKIIELK